MSERCRELIIFVTSHVWHLPALIDSLVDSLFFFELHLLLARISTLKDTIGNFKLINFLLLIRLRESILRVNLLVKIGLEH